MMGPEPFDNHDVEGGTALLKRVRPKPKNPTHKTILKRPTPPATQPHKHKQLNEHNKTQQH